MKNGIVVTQSMADRVSECRSIKGLTQEQLKQKADVSITKLSTIENGKGSVLPDTMNRIAHALDVDPDYLLCKTDYRNWLEKSRHKFDREMGNFNSFIKFLDVRYDVEFHTEDETYPAYLFDFTCSGKFGDRFITAYLVGEDGEDVLTDPRVSIDGKVIDIEVFIYLYESFKDYIDSMIERLSLLQQLSSSVPKDFMNMVIDREITVPKRENRK